MLISLFAWAYISLICLIWGNMLLSLLSRSGAPASNPVNACLVCFAGLAGISAVVLCLSLFIPLGLPAHILILAPALYHCLKAEHRRSLRLQLQTLTDGVTATGYCLWIACILMVLVISAYHIQHPDTLGYHARSVLLFEKYRPVPGIANLRQELGLVSSWFAALAIFKLDLPAFDHIIFLNGAVLCWYFTFLIPKITGTKHGWKWLLLLAFSILDPTAVRLTAASPSPDFIVTLYIWSAIYLFATAPDQQDAARPDDRTTLHLIVLYCFAAILIKLSAIAIILLVPAAIFLTKRGRLSRLLLLYTGLGTLMFIPLFIRNIISSGYLLYPSSIPDFFQVSWKMPATTIRQFENYINIFARLAITTPLEHPERFSFFRWVPTWWSGLGITDQVLITGIIIGIILNIAGVFFRSVRTKRLQTEVRSRIIPLLIVLTGSIVWFLKAPSPRFGFGMLIPLFYFLFLDGFKYAAISSAVLRLLIACSTAATLSFSIYRFLYFFSSPMLLSPAGISNDGYLPIDCSVLKADLSQDIIEVHPQTACPCNGEDQNRKLLPRGHTVSDGFQFGH